MEDYAFTLKYVQGKHSVKYTPSSYDDILSMWRALGCVIETKYYEDDKSGRCHVHGIVNIPKNLLRKRMMRVGLHCKLERIYDRGGWISYIRKAQPKRLLFKQVVIKSISESDQSNEEDDNQLSPEDDVMSRIKRRLF